MVVQRRTLITALIILFISLIGIVFGSTGACRICVLFLFMICILRGIRERYILNPYYMFALVPLSLLIYIKMSDYHLELTVNTWIIAIINIATFIIAMEFTPGFKHWNKCKGVGEGKQLTYNTIILVILGFLPTVYSIVMGGTMPLASIFTLFSYGAIMCALKSKRKVLIVGVLLIFVVSWIGYVSKSTVLTLAICVLIGYEKYYVESPRQKKKLIILSVLGLLLMIAAFSFANQGRENASGQAAIDYYTRFGGVNWNGSSALFMPYMYLTTPWSNLQYVMKTQATHTYGLWLIRPLLGYLQIDNLFTHLYSLRAYSSFNTFTYIAVCFKDFGFWGSCISSAFLGYFTKKVYSRFKVSKSPLDIACYALVAQAVIEMFFSNHFFTQSYPFTIVIVLGIYKFVFCKNNLVELESEYTLMEEE